MKRWEYTTVDYDKCGRSTPNFEAMIGIRGAEGWELVTVVATTRSGMLGESTNQVAWFKREVG